MPQAPAQAIEPPDEDAGEAALVGIGQEAGKFGAVGGGSRDSSVHVLLGDRPPSRRSQSPKFMELDFRILLGGGNSRVKGNRKTLIGG
jgi:hypothetical protein